MSKTLSTNDVPPQFLKAAYLVGHVPLKSLASDARISYSLYIPPTQYETGANAKKLPLLVWIHGTRRLLDAIDGGELESFAESTPCAILAPLFPAGLDGPNDLDSYKSMRSKTLRSDLALLSILDEIAPRWPGLETDRFFMLGFSGGGQFAHRFLYLHPERLLGISVGAPGRATMLNPTLNWPNGVADLESLFGLVLDKQRIRRVSIQLAVGSADNEVHGGNEFWEWLQKLKGKEPKLAEGGNLATMTQGRLQTLQNLQASWKSDGIDSQLDVVEGAAHEAGKVRPCQLQFLWPLMQAAFQNTTKKE
ncbi:uncharacterized protein N7484_007942 [Penicillium longicatenatum]|uniref:uncharacterized protein n=1 Tax=Penicillium longicatenatum TaxID=1561947 RepID=UPI0025492D55|nr:uncharacterized protein N7484_007942 [Penicillium longicatenatum]KAJ5640080.1 hypothetical protein N7484_007942 [Penicillium longicatenatum]